MKKSLLLLVVILSSAFSQVMAQPEGDHMSPPKVLLLVREEIKPGMMGGHSRHSAEFASLFSQLQTPNHRIAIVPVAGNENEVIYITPLDSFAELEGKRQATDKLLSAATGMTKANLDRLDKEGPLLHATMRDMWGLYRPDLSFNPGVPIQQMRYFSITTIRIRPGQDARFTDYAKELINAARKAKVDTYHTAVFQIVSGARAGTYLLFRPFKSLSELDDPVGVKVRAALGDDQRKDIDKEIGEVQISSETSTYAFSPRMSYVTREFAAGDPAFWNPKPEISARPKPKQRAPKPPPPSR